MRSSEGERNRGGADGTFVWASGSCTLCSNAGSFEAVISGDRCCALVSLIERLVTEILSFLGKDFAPNICESGRSDVQPERELMMEFLSDIGTILPRRSR